jgi:hypothetical protein
MVAEARIVEMDEAAREGRVYVVTCSPRLVTSTHQARQVERHRDVAVWLGKECAIERLLPDGMVTSKERTEDRVLTVLEHWLEHGERSIVAKRTTAQQRNRKTQQRERGDRDNPWVVTITLLSAMMATRKRLGKTVGQEVLSFQRRDAPLEIQACMHQQIRVWHNGKRDKDQWGGGPNRTKPGRTTAEILQRTGETECSLGARAGGRMDKGGNEGLGAGAAC